MRHAIIPTLQYADAHAAIDFLVTAFGFTRHAVYDDGAGGVAHAQLLLDDNMVMVSTLRPGNIYGIDTPAKLGGVTGSISVSLDDPDAHYARAVAAGADIIVGVKDQDYGGRSYDVRDPGGHVWTFGSYDPWAV
ncbi:VOC family protein [Sphingosinicellaceae bacterium]|nr:VOC family protein [Sphingosinicellaceae bacterium]